MFNHQDSTFFCGEFGSSNSLFLISTKDTWIETGNCLAIPRLIIFFDKLTSSTLWFFKHPEMFNPCLGWGFPKIRLLERIAKKIAKVLRGFHVHCRPKNSNVIGVENSPKMTCVWFQVKLWTQASNFLENLTDDTELEYLRPCTALTKGALFPMPGPSELVQMNSSHENRGFGPPKTLRDSRPDLEVLIMS